MSSTSITKDQQQPQRISWRLAAITAATGISISALKRDIYAGHLQARKNGRATIVLDADLREYLNNLPPAKSGAKETSDAKSIAPSRPA